MTKPNVVLFCGAGFSRGAGIPTMLEFVDAIYRSELISSEDKDVLADILSEAVGLANSVGANARNIEDLASALQMVSLTDPDFRFLSRSDRTSTIAEARHTLMRCIACAVKPNLTSKEVRSARKMLDTLFSKSSATVITTNYDLHVELAATHQNNSVYPGDRILHACVKQHHTPARSIRSCYSKKPDATASLFKLHGSINWLMTGDDLSVENRCTAVETRDDWGQVVRSHYVFGPEPNNNWLHAPDTCHIVPPTMIKTDLDDTLKEQWRLAADAIRNAERIAFVGYSFPPSDTFMRFFLASVLYRHSRLSRIVVVDPSLDTSNVQSLFPTQHLQSMLQMVPSTWESSDLLARLVG